jgi:ribose 5-phosphate isomerase B
VKIALGSDHAGFAGKTALVRALRRAGHRVIDAGPADGNRVDYPDFVAAVGRAVSAGRADRGVLVCGSGIGMAIAANKIRGVRAAVVWSEKTAGLAAAHNRANVLCLGGRLFRAPRLIRFVRIWLKTPFEAGRHVGRIDKIAALEKRARR